MTLSTISEQEMKKHQKVRTLNTKLGVIAYDDADIVTFERGPFGFEQEKNFILAFLPFEGMPDSYRLLQSIDNPDISMILANIRLSSENPEKNLIAIQHILPFIEDRNLLLEDCIIFLVISVFEENGQQRMSVNVKAPIIIDNITQKAEQIILPEKQYSINAFYNYF